MKHLLAGLLCLAGWIPAAAQSRLAVPAYDISVRMLTAEQRLEIDAQVTVPPAASPTDTITFQLDARCSDPEVLLLGPSAIGKSVSVVRTGGRLTLALSSATTPGDPTVVRFRYSIGTTRARSFYITTDSAYISGEAFPWYPRPTAARRATGRLRFSLPDGVVVAATGQRQHANAATGAAHDFIITEPTTFSFAAGRHQVVQRDGSPPIGIHLLRSRPLVRERLDSLRRILDALVTEFGTYPHSDLEIVEMPSQAAGGRDSAVSLEGFVVVGPGVMDSFMLPIVAHEVSHQWWADCVFGVGPSSVLLTETMAQYGALRATEAIHGERAAAEFRWRGYPGESLLAGGRGYLSLLVADLDTPLTSPALASTLPVTKGLLVHDLLSRTVGPERFREFLKAFIGAHAFEDVTWRAFITEATATFGDRVGTFVRDWYEQKGIPELTISWSQQNGQLRGTIVQTPLQYSGSIELAVNGTDRRSLLSVSIAGERTEFSLAVDFMVSSVQLDPNYKIPHHTAERMAEAHVVSPLARALKVMRTGGTDFLSAAKETLSPSAGAPVERSFLLEALLAEDALERGDEESARTHLRAALASPHHVREFLPGLYYQQAVLAATIGDRDLMRRAATAAIDADAALVAPTDWGRAARELLTQVR